MSIENKKMNKKQEINVDKNKKYTVYYWHNGARVVIYSYKAQRKRMETFPLNTKTTNAEDVGIFRKVQR